MNQLEQLLAKAMKDPSAQGEFIAHFLASPIYVLNAEPSGVESKHTLKEGTTVKLINGQFENGETYLPMFTSEEQVSKSIAEEMSYLAIDGAALLQMVRGSNVYINPMDNGPYWPAEIVERILQDFLGQEQVTEKETQVLLGLPAENPVELKRAVSEVLAGEEDVRAAYLALMYKAGDQSLVIGIITDRPEMAKNVFDKAGAVGSRHLPEGYFLDFVVINDKESEGLEEFLINSGDKFYATKGN
jgi:hypothetical protein